MDRKLLDILKGTLCSLLAATASAALVWLFIALLLWRTELPEQYLSLYGLIGCGIGAIAAGYGGGLMMKQKGMIWGMCFGVCYLILLMTILFLITGGVVYPSVFRPEWLICVVLSALSGMFSVNLRKE